MHSLELIRRTFDKWHCPGDSREVYRRWTTISHREAFSTVRWWSSFVVSRTFHRRESRSVPHRLSRSRETIGQCRTYSLVNQWSSTFVSLDLSLSLSILVLCLELFRLIIHLPTRTFDDGRSIGFARASTSTDVRCTEKQWTTTMLDLERTTHEPRLVLFVLPLEWLQRGRTILITKDKISVLSNDDYDQNHSLHANEFKQHDQLVSQSKSTSLLRIVARHVVT